MLRSIWVLFVSILMAFGQDVTPDGYPVYETLALPGDGGQLYFKSSLWLRGEFAIPRGVSRIYRHELIRPYITLTANFQESFVGPFVSTDGAFEAQFCSSFVTTGRLTVNLEGVCFSRDGERTFHPGTRSRISRNGRFVFQRDGNANLLRDLATKVNHALPVVEPLHSFNAVSNRGTLVATPPVGLNQSVNRRAVALVRPDEAARVIYEGEAVGLAAITADERYVFVRADRADGISSLIEIELGSGVRRTIFETQSDRFSFSLDESGSRVLIRYFQALSLWERASGLVRRIADTPDMIISAVLSDDGNTAAYQQNNGSITRVRLSGTYEAEKLYVEMPEVLSSRSRTAYSGSAVEYSVRGFSKETKVLIAGREAPVIRLEDTSILGQQLILQIPFEVDVTASFFSFGAIEQPGSPFVMSFSVSFLSEPTPGFFPSYDAATRSYGILAALQDFSGVISSTNPAPAGSTIHAYLGGLGPLDQVVGTGEPGPSNPPAMPLAGIRCEIRLLETNGEERELAIPSVTYAPGLVGVYQVDLTIPEGWPAGYNRLRCFNQNRAGDESRMWTSAP